MRFQILGPLVLEADDGALRIRGVRRQLLLANMLLDANQVVPLARLVDSLWPDDPPQSAVENIRTYVCELRSDLRARGDRPRLETHVQAYRLDAEAEELDLLRFNAFAAAGDEALRQSDAAVAADLLGMALDLWRGAPLSGLELAPAMEARVASLQERHRMIESKWIKARLALGEHEDLVPILREKVSDRPLDESLWRTLATTLHLLGRRGEALTACSDARTALVDELGVDPGPELKQLQLAILNGRDPPERQESARTPTGQSIIPSQLPSACASFVGREAALGRIDEVVREHTARMEPRVTLVALHGPPGIGKTATALMAAARLKDRFPDGQLYARLDGSAEVPVDPAEALGTLLSGFGLDPETLPATLKTRCSLYRSLLADRQMLIVLDDVAGVEQLTPLLPGGRSVMLLTCRQWLADTAVDADILLGPLCPKKSLRLLRGIVGDARVEGELETAAAITDACGHVPLAVRVAGIRMAARPSHPLEVLADRLLRGSVLDELNVDGVDFRERYASAYKSLDDESQRCFRALSGLDPDQVSATAVGETLGVSAHIADGLLEQLVRQGLLVCCSGLGGDFRLPRVLHAYADELAAGDGSFAVDDGAEAAAASSALYPADSLVRQAK
jgi:DNA-binding SARP family transcriptional activator